MISLRTAAKIASIMYVSTAQVKLKVLNLIDRYLVVAMYLPAVECVVLSICVIDDFCESAGHYFLCLLQ